MTILLLMDLRRIFQTFHECVYFLLSVQFVRIRVVVFHDFVCKISKNHQKLQGQGENQYYESLVKIMPKKQKKLEENKKCVFKRWC